MFLIYRLIDRIQMLKGFQWVLSAFEDISYYLSMKNTKSYTRSMVGRVLGALNLNFINNIFFNPNFLFSSTRRSSRFKWTGTNWTGATKCERWTLAAGASVGLTGSSSIPEQTTTASVAKHLASCLPANIRTVQYKNPQAIL